MGVASRPGEMAELTLHLVPYNDMTTTTMQPKGPSEDTWSASCRTPRQSDARAISALVKACPPLDANSTYAYLLVCTHFANTSITAEADGQVIGFISAYLTPEAPTTLFVWQVAVGSAFRGRGLGQAMLRSILERETCRHVRHLEATFTPSNETSLHMFKGLARSLDVPCEVRPRFTRDDLGGNHEPEHLVRIGPLQCRSRRGS